MNQGNLIGGNGVSIPIQVFRNFYSPPSFSLKKIGGSTNIPFKSTSNLLLSYPIKVALNLSKQSYPKLHNDIKVGWLSFRSWFTYKYFKPVRIKAQNKFTSSVSEIVEMLLVTGACGSFQVAIRNPTSNRMAIISIPTNGESSSKLQISWIFLLNIIVFFLM